MTDPTFRSLFSVTVPDHWTPDQVLAVVEFIGDLRQTIWVHYGDLREAIWAHYHKELTEAYRERKLSEPVRPLPGTSPDDSSCGGAS
jgi:hypothetical protein